MPSVLFDVSAILGQVEVDVDGLNLHVHGISV